MSIGIKDIGIYLPNNFIDSKELLNKFNVTEEFIFTKTGFTKLVRRIDEESILDMACKAFDNLQVDIKQIDLICVCSQNPDRRLPHISAQLQSLLGAKKNVMTFDISLGCSGYAYGIAICCSLLKQLNLSSALFFTCDPYSNYLDKNDKNTQMLFGDAATVTLLSGNADLIPTSYSFETFGDMAEKLYSDQLGVIHMDGRGIFNFSMKNVVNHIKQQILQHGASDIFLLHQASKFVIDSVRTQLNIESCKVPFHASNYGNTVSSSIPIMLKDYLFQNTVKKISLVGFGVGLSISSLILERR